MFDNVEIVKATSFCIDTYDSDNIACFQTSLNFIYKKICNLENRAPYIEELTDYFLTECMCYDIRAWKLEGALLPSSMIINSIGDILDLQRTKYIDYNGEEVNDAQIIMFRRLYDSEY